ncbi:hypothetical protein CH380_21070 [Leptospira adleri]|uniref:Uncharacterized protein n=1 Tax=Leptospira adleri TaxID=2023186 RepID=A0A2M9YIC0_9LEPT|nr:hypothetical protein CH380_21070 [Leptospira adleri]PJZ59870.1 hypothetical protein CH376_21495 [Leptospira adleri]
MGWQTYGFTLILIFFIRIFEIPVTFFNSLRGKKGFEKPESFIGTKPGLARFGRILKFPILRTGTKIHSKNRICFSKNS